MLKLSENTKIHVCLEPVDMRKALNGLSALILEDLNGDLVSGDLYIFCNKPRDKVKIVYWHKNGFVLHYKRLEKHRFKFPKVREGQAVEINSVQLEGLLAGLDFTLMQEFSDINYASFL